MSYVSISKPVKDRIVQAARETPTEIIGLLLGRLQDDTIVIEDSTTEEFSSEPHRVMLPPNSVAIIADRLVSGKLKGNIVGWYHSHTEGGLFFSETDIATQKKLQQFSSLVTGVVVDSTTGEVGYFRIIPGTNQAVRLNESYVTVFTDPTQAVPKGRPTPRSVAPTPTVEVRRRLPRATAISRRMALSIIVIALIISMGVFVAVLYRYGASTPQQPVEILHTPVSSGTVGTPIAILTNVTGPGRNVTLVYGQAVGGQASQVTMTPLADGEYSYLIPGSQVTGSISYYVKAYDPTGREVNTTVYHIAIADFGLQPESNSLTVYRNKTATVQLLLLSINNFNQQIELSTNGNPTGLNVSFSANPAASGTEVALKVGADETVSNGTYPVTVIATYAPPQSPRVTRESVVDITVADFRAAATPSSATVNAGSTATLSISLTLEKGFVDPVSITSISGLPQGATYTVTASNPTVLGGGPGTTHVTLQIKVVASTKAGTYPIVIVISGGGVTHSLTAQIIVR